MILCKGSKLLWYTRLVSSCISKQLPRVTSSPQLHSWGFILPLHLGQHKFKLFTTACSMCGTLNPQYRSFHTTQANAKMKKGRKPITFNKKSQSKLVPIWKNMTVQDLANNANKTVDEIFEAFLYIEGSERYDLPQSILSDLNVIQKTVKIFGMRFVIRAPEKESEDTTSVKDAFRSPPAPPEDLEPRPPIVTIMGHVDHGKTTLLDTLRHSSIVDTEHGGITQHIGAFEVTLPSGAQVTFLDTPGHAAFSAMRARGANVTDLIVLVVAADDGVLPQTTEVIALAREIGTPVVVAINKIDKPEADVERCKRMLLNAGLQLEEQGGDVQAVEISALKGTNVTLLLEALVMQAELLDIRSTRKGLVEGTVLESKVDPQRGKVATCLVQRGTLTKGAVLIAETFWAKVRNLFDSTGKPVEKALPGMSVQVIGWREGIPSAGAELLELEGERRAREVASFREVMKKKAKEEEDFKVIKVKVEEHIKSYREQLEKKRQMGIRFKLYRGRPPLEKQFKEDTHPRVCIVLKGDVDGSVEAILDVIDTYHSEEVALDVLSYGVGAVTPSDIEMAKAFKGIIFTFNIALKKDLVLLAKENGVPIRAHNVIYRLIDNLKEEISALLPPKPTEELLGEAVVQQEFLISEGRKKVPVAGCRCVKGQLVKTAAFKVIRSLEEVHEGEVQSLRHLKKEVDTIKKDVECGIRFADPSLRFQPGDSIVCFGIKMVERLTDWSPEGF